jgi:hypothetical protein
MNDETSVSKHVGIRRSIREGLGRRGAKAPLLARRLELLTALGRRGRVALAVAAGRP